MAGGGRDEGTKKPRLGGRRGLGNQCRSGLGLSLGRGAGLADEAVDGLGDLGANSDPFLSLLEVDGVVDTFLEWIVGADLLDVTTIAALAAVDSDDLVVGTIFGSLTVEAECDGHVREFVESARRVTGGRGN